MSKFAHIKISVNPSSLFELFGLLYMCIALFQSHLPLEFSQQIALQSQGHLRIFDCTCVQNKY